MFFFLVNLNFKLKHPHEGIFQNVFINLKCLFLMFTKLLIYMFAFKLFLCLLMTYFHKCQI